MLSFFSTPAESAQARHFPFWLDGINQESLLAEALAQFVLGSPFGYLVVNFAARVGILENEFGHDLFRTRLGCFQPTRPGRKLKFEHLFIEHRISTLVGKLEDQDSIVLTADNQARDLHLGETRNSTCL